MTAMVDGFTSTGDLPPYALDRLFDIYIYIIFLFM